MRWCTYLIIYLKVKVKVKTSICIARLMHQAPLTRIYVTETGPASVLQRTYLVSTRLSSDANDMATAQIIF